jgi:hypothetical protein
MKGNCDKYLNVLVGKPAGKCQWEDLGVNEIIE